MNARCDEPFVRISITITGPEPIFPWGRTYRSHERFSRPKGARRSGTASRWNASPLRTVGCLKRVENSQAARCSFLAFEISCPNIACALLRLDKLVHQNQAGPQTARPLWFVWRRSEERRVGKECNA